MKRRGNRSGMTRRAWVDVTERLESRVLLAGSSGFDFPGEVPAAYPVDGSPFAITTADFDGDGKIDVATAGNSGISVLRNVGGGAFAPRVTYGTGGVCRSIVATDVNGDGHVDLVAANASLNTILVLMNLGNGTFASPVSYGVGNMPMCVAAADLNGDGAPDLVTANYSDNTVSVLRNLGDGTFAAAASYIVGASPQYVVAADLTGDGMPDLVIANSGINSLSVLQNLGNGAFAQRVPVPAGNPQQSILAADLNRDGKVDLAFASEMYNSVAVAWNQGGGTLATRLSYSAGLQVHIVTAGDVNGDGWPDLVATDSATNSIISVMLNQHDGTFSDPKLYASGKATTCLAVADVDGDGKADVIVGNSGTNMIAVFRNMGDGTFTPDGNLVTGRPRCVVAADVNGDGTMDVIVGNSAITVFSNLGDGTFAAPRSYTVDGGPVSVIAADLNGDGFLDIATANEMGYSVTVLRNLGDGTFAPQVSYPVDYRPECITAVDVDGDGKLDLVAAITGVTGMVNGSLSVLRNKGDGTFAPAVSLNLMQLAVWAVAAADVDGDGKVDLVAMHEGGADMRYGLSVLRNLGNGTFSDPVTYRLDSVGYSIATVDVDGDGRIDLVVPSSSGKLVSVLRNLGNGAFAPRVDYTVARSSGYVAATDVDGDGKPDLVLGGAVLRNRGDGTFDPQAAYDALGAPFFADFDGDGKVDLVTAVSGGISIVRNLGHGAFGAAQTYSGAWPYSITGADVDGDGNVDLVTPTAGSSVYVSRNLGNGTFATPVSYAVGNSPVSVTAADFNGDGKPDLASANSVSNSVSILRNLGNGTYASQIIYLVGTSPSSIYAADFNGDGKPDLATANSGSNSVSVLRNQGSGTFASAVSYAVGTRPTCVIAADVNGDGKKDLITANGTSGTVSVLRNLGTGTFATQVTYAVGGSPNSVAALDVDGDGKIDLVTADSADNTISVLRNLGNGTFATRVICPVGWSPSLVAGADVDADGKMDVVVTEAGYSPDYVGTVSVLRNLGNGTFAARQSYAVGSRPWSVFAADLNGDGTIDLATANRNSYTISVLPNIARHPFDLRVTADRSDNRVYVKAVAGTVKWWIGLGTAAMPNPATDPPTGTEEQSLLTHAALRGLDGSDTFILDFSSGNFIPPGGLTIDGGGGNDTVIFKGLSGDVDLTKIGGLPISYTGIEKIAFADGSVRIASLPPGVSLDVSGSALVTITSSIILPSLSIERSGQVILAGGGHVLQIGSAAAPAVPDSLKITTPEIDDPAQFAGLDLTDGGLIVQAGNAADRDALLAAVTALVAMARNTKDANGVLWGGDGIRCSAAAALAAADSADKTGLMGIAIAANFKTDQDGTIVGPLMTVYRGQSGLDVNTVVAGYALNGDANLDGLVNFDDYYLINSGYLSGATGGYHNGDFNFDKLIGFDDYFLINRAFLGQGSALMSAPAAMSLSPAAPADRVAKVLGRRRKHVRGM